MTKHIELTTPNLAELGLEMQDKIVGGYRLDESFPQQIGYLYVAKMTKAETVADAVKMLSNDSTVKEELVVPEQKRPGRPAKAK